VLGSINQNWCSLAKLSAAKIDNLNSDGELMLL